MEDITHKTDSLRPTKKQREMLSFIVEFISVNGYSPSYREIMAGLDYTSVATVALHVGNLIKRGHLQKRDNSARSLEVVQVVSGENQKLTIKQLKASEEKWLVEKIELFFKDVEVLKVSEEKHLDNLYVLVGALKVLALDGAAQSYIARLGLLKKRRSNNEYVV